MKFSFKIQQYQTDAVAAVADVFAGQSNARCDTFLHLDSRSMAVQENEANPHLFSELEIEAAEDILGYANNPVQVQPADALHNIRQIQDKYNIPRSTQLETVHNQLALDVEMETGTGKTYVYIKTIFELNKRYGWNKFIIVVPSIAIREGVKKSFSIMEEHFMTEYQKKARYFVYDGRNEAAISSFATDNAINVMIINTQAFNSSFDENKNVAGRKGNQNARLMYTHRDAFGSLRPIDVISNCRPIMILDEPQKMGSSTSQTMQAMAQFKPLFFLHYSATHKIRHNLVYALDAIDAYNKKLVKKIEVKGFELHNLQGMDSYVFLQEVVLSDSKPPMALLDFEVMQKSGVKRSMHKVQVGDNLQILSNGMKQYAGYVVSEINPAGRGTVTFTNGVVVEGRRPIGDVSELDERRLQIVETIKAHFKKEEMLYNKGIKTLSLFFIDEVANYRSYDEDGNVVLGEYGRIFEQEYNRIFDDKLLSLDDSEYKRYLERAASEVSRVHTGYFSIDKKGRSVDAKARKNEESANDENAARAYDLIMKEKEKLLSFEEPVRFIFSHSALSEGWDNPNIFQICTLKHSGSDIKKRQEVGRGMRLCVDQSGNRMDWAACDDRDMDVHDINLLTVVASESYESFVSSLQQDMRENLRDRPQKVSLDVFKHRHITVEDKEYVISDEQAHLIYLYMAVNGYIDDNTQMPSAQFKEDAANNALAEVQSALKPMEPVVHTLVKAIFDDSALNKMIVDGTETKMPQNRLNKNFHKKEFQELWQRINHKYAYTVSFDSNELIANAAGYISANLRVTEVKYTLKSGMQADELQRHHVEAGDSFNLLQSSTKVLKNAHESSIRYDLLHEIASRTTLTRRTVAAILGRLPKHVYAMFRSNPEEFIRKASVMINEQKAALIVEGVEYNTTEETFDSEIFNTDISMKNLSKAFEAKKHVLPYVVTDGMAEKSVERRFAEAMDVAAEVAVYAKLPRGFYIPTPVGNYSPDWAIAFKEGSVQYMYFVAETKGSNSSLELRPIEKAKINCAEKLFKKLSNGEVRYGQVKDYASLLDIVLGRAV